MKVLIACEESQEVCKAFRELGHEAYSCDLLPCSGGHPEWHIQGDVLKHLNDGWDLMIAHPPCTHLSISGASIYQNQPRIKMETKFNLSEKILDLYALNMEDTGMSTEAISKEDVKEFIRLLKEVFEDDWAEKQIDKLAGEQLTK